MAAKTALFTRATSLGSYESLIEHRASIEGPESATPDDLLRVSVGLENPEDLIADLGQALGDNCPGPRSLCLGSIPTGWGLLTKAANQLLHQWLGGC